MIPASLDCARLHTAYREGLAPGDVVREVFARIGAARDAGIFLSLVPQADAAAAAPALASFDPVAKPLWGLRFAVKDNIDVAMP